ARWLGRRWGRSLRRTERRLPASKFERPLFALTRLARPHFAELVVAREQRVETEAARVVAHLLLAELVDVHLDVPTVLHRRHLGDSGEELVVLVLQFSDVFFELLEL